MKQAQAENVTMLKQKLIYYQSELSRYQEKLREYKQGLGQLKRENGDLRKRLEQAERAMEELSAKLEDIQAENVLLKELAMQSEKRYEEMKQLLRRNEELEKQLQQFKKNLDATEEEASDSWFIRTLKQQNAIAPPSSDTKGE